MKGKSKVSRAHMRWTAIITILAFIISVVMSFLVDIMFSHTGATLSFIILIAIVLIGILFDTIGVAVTVADEKPFHSMASAKVKGSLSSIKLIKNASKVSNLCNDVIGDICGIISGSSAAYIVINIVSIYPTINSVIFSMILSGAVAALTIGGKALGKEIAIGNAKSVVMVVGKIVSVFERK